MISLRNWRASRDSVALGLLIIRIARRCNHSWASYRYCAALSQTCEQYSTDERTWVLWRRHNRSNKTVSPYKEHLASAKPPQWHTQHPDSHSLIKKCGPERGQVGLTSSCSFSSMSASLAVAWPKYRPWIGLSSAYQLMLPTANVSLICRRNSAGDQTEPYNIHWLEIRGHTVAKDPNGAGVGMWQPSCRFWGASQIPVAALVMSTLMFKDSSCL